MRPHAKTKHSQKSSSCTCKDASGAIECHCGKLNTLDVQKTKISYNTPLDEKAKRHINRVLTLEHKKSFDFIEIIASSMVMSHFPKKFSDEFKNKIKQNVEHFVDSSFNKNKDIIILNGVTKLSESCVGGMMEIILSWLDKGFKNINNTIGNILNPNDS